MRRLGNDSCRYGKAKHERRWKVDARNSDVAKSGVQLFQNGQVFVQDAVHALRDYREPFSLQKIYSCKRAFCRFGLRDLYVSGLRAAPNILLRGLPNSRAANFTAQVDA